MAVILIPKPTSADDKSLVNKVPPHISNILTSKIGIPINESKTDEDLLISSEKEKTRKEEFLKEIQQQFEQ